jgi:hypothetical protein
MTNFIAIGDVVKTDFKYSDANDSDYITGMIIEQWPVLKMQYRHNDKVCSLILNRNYDKFDILSNSEAMLWKMENL